MSPTMSSTDNKSHLKAILFLCTGNSCRSQMAEAIVNHYLGDKCQAYSAGTKPTGYVHPMAIQVLEEIGIQQNGYSKDVDVFRGKTFNTVITVCDSAAEECPAWLGKGNLEHLGFPDPAKVLGTEQEKLDAFRRVRDEIKQQILVLFKLSRLDKTH